MRVFLLLIILLTVISGSKSGEEPLLQNKTISSNDSINGISYDIAEEIYIDQDVKISYPQISKFNDNHKQKNNELIKNEVFKAFIDFIHENSNLSLEIN